MRVPSATYRLQLNSTFRFSDARRLVPYLHALGITDLYASPIFAARSASAHGYDVIDPQRLNPELGTDEDFDALVRALRERDMGLLLDIVPNHMAASSENPWWADVLEHGVRSEYAPFFDIDWDRGGGKVVLPILGKPLEEVLDAGEVSLVADQQRRPSLQYSETRLPIAPASRRLAARLAQESAPDLRPLLAEQAYRLAHWRTGTREINYRRFFNINELVSVRIEDDRVFDATHELTLRLVRSGAVTGLRVDHVDGLYDPAAYLGRLQAKLGDPSDGVSSGERTYVVVEKILTGSEGLPRTWEVSGTTGYDFLNDVNGLFVDPAGVAKLNGSYAELTGSTRVLADVAYEQKRRIATLLFEAETEALADRLLALAAGVEMNEPLSREELREALIEVSACLPVYRTYVTESTVDPADHDRIEYAVASARSRNPNLPPSAFDVLCRVLLRQSPPSLSQDQRAAWLEFIERWQQFTGPLAAKGVEDTALYQYNPLISLNEVGVDPEAAGAIDVETFHLRNRERLARWPATMNATATHDTKRGEDARARIDVLSELADEWSDCLRRWSAWNGDTKRIVNGAPVPDPNEEVLLYQTLVGAWPLEADGISAFGERLKAFIVKAAREAKVHTSWQDLEVEYEAALTAFVDRLLQDRTSRFMSDLLAAQPKIAFCGAMNALSQIVLKMTSPGVPDFYRGTELWDLTLVDPDNRRSVDFHERRRLLEELIRDDAEDAPHMLERLVHNWDDGRLKLYVTAKVLRWRRAHHELFLSGDYLPIAASPDAQRHVVGFARRHDGVWAVVVVPRMVAALVEPGTPPVGRTVWRNATVTLPVEAPRMWTNILTAETVEVQDEAAQKTLPVAALLGRLPVAVLTAPGQ